MLNFRPASYISKLDDTKLSQLADTVVGCTGLQEELHQAHLLTAEHGAHDLREIVTDSQRERDKDRESEK